MKKFDNNVTMLEQPKEIRKIYMVSSAAFGMASVIYGWMTPISAALGLAANITTDKITSNVINELEEAVIAALKSTENSIPSISQKEIIKELIDIKVQPDSLSELIKKTEAYQSQFCTDLDTREIINLFEIYFRYEISERPNLSSLYILSTGLASLDKLNNVNEILISNDRKLDEIKNGISDIRKGMSDVRKVCLKLLSGFSFVLVAMAIFLGSGIFSFHTYDRVMLIIAPVCYGISEFLIFCLNKEGYIYESIRKGMRYDYIVSENVQKKVITFIMPIILTVALFLIIYCAIDIEIQNESLLFTTMSLVLGNIVSILLKEARFIF